MNHPAWGKSFILAAALTAHAAFQDPQAEAGRARLAEILKKSGVYCQRLVSAALDFVCQEEVKEMSARLTPEVTVYLYDYQFIRKSQETKERRELLSVDGKRASARDSRLQTVMFRYENVLFGPVGLLSESWQPYHDYRLVGEETLNGEKAVVVEATPRPGTSEPHCYGRLWIKEKDGSVLRIVWDQKSLGNFSSVNEWAKAHGAEPQITASSEYGLEKKGLRFPSRNYSEQAYLTSDGRKIVSGWISALYKDYRFFTVETEIQYEAAAGRTPR